MGGAQKAAGDPEDIAATRGMKPAGSSQWEAWEVTEISIVEIERISKKGVHRYRTGNDALRSPKR